MMRRVMTTLLILFSLGAGAQEVETIKNDPGYLSGEGWGESLKAADNAALQDLISKISVSVEGEFKSVEEEVSTQGKIDSRAACQSVVNTYSQATLQNTQRIVISNEPDAHVFRYVKRSDVDKIFASRRVKLLDMVQNAAHAETEGKVDVALRYFYWSYCLLQSLPNANEVMDAQQRVLVNWIPQQMNAIFAQLKVVRLKEEGTDIALEVRYKGQPVTSFDYTYFDGMDWSNIYSAVDGRGFIELRPGASVKNLKLKCEYEYAGEAHIDKEIATVVNVMKGRVFRDAYLSVQEGDVALAEKSAEQKAATETVPVGRTPDAEAEQALSLQPSDSLKKGATLTFLTPEEQEPYRQTMEGVMKAIKAKNYAQAEPFFTPEGKEMFRKLLSYGHCRLMGEPELTYLSIRNEVTCRSLPMCFSFPNNNRKFVENVTFTFQEDHLINSIAFGLDEKASTDILRHDKWGEEARKILAEFLENYKTAFALKRLDYIRSIFDDNAVIITGKLVPQPASNQNENNRYLNNRVVKLTRQNKETYLRNLANCFRSNEYINIRFTNNDIIKMGNGGEVYGIQIKQDYYSANYGDTGYLFLMVDLNDPKSPVIKVRAWQPEKDPNFGSTGLVGPEHF